jgi:hypothetical protein
MWDWLFGKKDKEAPKLIGIVSTKQPTDQTIQAKVYVAFRYTYKLTYKNNTENKNGTSTFNWTSDLFTSYREALESSYKTIADITERIETARKNDDMLVNFIDSSLRTDSIIDITAGNVCAVYFNDQFVLFSVKEVYVEQGQDLILPPLPKNTVFREG